MKVHNIQYFNLNFPRHCVNTLNNSMIYTFLEPNWFNMGVPEHFIKPRPRRRGRYKNQFQRLNGNMNEHVLEKIKPTNKPNPTKPCVVCKVHGKRSESRYICRSCEAPLHCGECFTNYHTLENY